MKSPIFFSSLLLLALFEPRLSLCANESTDDLSQDSNLRDVTFIDPDRGWAAGERGTILQTQDGGVTWTPQLSGVRSTLSAIAMYNSQRGLAIGGNYEPYSQISRGEIVVTKDGGLSWNRVTGHDMPRLHHLIIGPRGQCIAVGDWSTLHLTSVFRSGDGGQTWQPERCEIDGDAVQIAGDTNDCLVLSDRGQVIRLKDDANPQTLFTAEHRWASIAANGDQRLLVGPRGGIISDDKAETWRAVTTNGITPFSLSSNQAACVTLVENEIWSLASSTAKINVVKDAVLSQVACPGEAALRGMIRFDKDRGWAVGDFGLIIGTRDRGQSWRVLRGGNRSPAVMVVGPQPESIPWSLLAIESLQYQHRVGIVIQNAARDQGPELPNPTIQAREMLADVSGLIGPVTSFYSHEDPNRIADILATARPAIVILQSTIPAAQRDQWATISLQAGVKRVIDIGDRGTQTMHVAAAIPAAGVLASDSWFDAISILSPGFLPPSRLMLTARRDTTNDGLTGESLAACIRNDDRFNWSRQPSASRRQLQVLQARTAETSWIESLITSSTSIDAFKSQLATIQVRMSAEDRDRMYSRLFSITSQRSQSEFYLAALEALVNQTTEEPSARAKAIPISPLRRLASLRLDAIRNSTEWHHTFGAVSTLSLASDRSPNNASQPIDLAVQLTPFQSTTTATARPNREVQLASGINNAPFAASRVELASAQQDVSPQSNTDLQWDHHPPILTARRSIETKQQASDVPIDRGTATSSALQRLADASGADRWAGLATNARSPETLFAGLTTKQPHLDGNFDESFWLGAQSFQLANEIATVRMAHDPNFVYLAIDGPPLAAATSSPEIRQRDTPLDQSDRFRIRLDVDRDLLTSFELEFDSAGNTRDSCDGYLPFNPRWFIACQLVDGRTHAEIAIQKSDFGTATTVVPTIWNLSLDRLNQHAPVRGVALPDPTQWRAVLLE